MTPPNSHLAVTTQRAARLVIQATALAFLLPLGASAENAAVAQCGAVATSVAPSAVAGAPILGTPGELMEQGLAAWGQGDLAGAAAAWLGAAQGYDEADDADGEAEALLRAAQARGAQGFVFESRSLLERSLALSESAGASGRAAATRGALAASFLETGDLTRSEALLVEALAEARQSSAEGLEARLLHTQGELQTLQGDSAAAAAAYLQSETLAAGAGDAPLAAQSAVAAARAQSAAGDAGARETLARAEQRIAALPESDAKAQAWVHAGRSYEELGATAAAARAYRAGADSAAKSGSHRSASYALGYLGALYEKQGRTDEALVLTRRAVAEGQAADAPEALYRWHWQLARLLATAGDAPGALAAYRRAVLTLEAMRSGQGATGLDFAGTVEPVYFGLVDLLLRQASATKDPAQRTALLSEARDHLEDLKSAELNDHFHDPCLAVQTTKQAGSVAGAVIVYPVVLPDRTEMIVSRPDGLTSVIVPVGREELEAEVNRFRVELQRRTTRRYRGHAAQLYEWLARPLLPELEGREVDALVFVPGGSLRTIPLAALYNRDTKQFLIEQYPMAVIPALTLTDPKPIDRENVRALMAGITESVQGYPALANVEPELTAVGEILRGDELVNDAFSESAVRQALGDQQFGIVHIASHGEFRAESSESFLLTYDGKLAMDELGVLVERTRFRDQPIELLTLSACQTAAGDDDAALGLAGVAIRAGARSALATLWTVNDAAAADLIAEFYRQLSEPGVSRAQALQRAQLSLLEARPYNHPGYWAAFLLISNWM